MADAARLPFVAATPLADLSSAAAAVHAVLPQTQCTRCGYPDCAAYAQAIADQGVAINQCPPGGDEGIVRLSKVTGRPVAPLNLEHGTEGPRTVAVIDETWCIGCTLCVQACPTDAILGASKWMHTVVEPDCTGCERCVPVCPVDCIELIPVSGSATGWAAWSADLAHTALQRYLQRDQRLQHDQRQRELRHETVLRDKLSDLGAHSLVTDPELLDTKRALVEQALRRAQANRAHPQRSDSRETGDT